MKQLLSLCENLSVIYPFRTFLKRRKEELQDWEEKNVYACEQVYIYVSKCICVSKCVCVYVCEQVCMHVSK